MCSTRATLRRQGPALDQAIHASGILLTEQLAAERVPTAGGWEQA